MDICGVPVKRTWQAKVKTLLSQLGGAALTPSGYLSLRFKKRKIEHDFAMVLDSGTKDDLMNAMDDAVGMDAMEPSDRKDLLAFLIVDLDSRSNVLTIGNEVFTVDQLMTKISEWKGIPQTQMSAQAFLLSLAGSESFAALATMTNSWRHAGRLF